MIPTLNVPLLRFHFLRKIKFIFRSAPGLNCNLIFLMGIWLNKIEPWNQRIIWRWCLFREMMVYYKNAMAPFATENSTNSVQFTEIYCDRFSFLFFSSQIHVNCEIKHIDWLHSSTSIYVLFIFIFIHFFFHKSSWDTRQFVQFWESQLSKCTAPKANVAKCFHFIVISTQQQWNGRMKMRYEIEAVKRKSY